MATPTVSTRGARFSEYIKLKNFFSEENTTHVAIAAAILVVLITLVLYLFARRRKNLRRGVLLVGLCDSGKTLIFSQLVHNRFVETLTSIKENSGLYQLPNNKGTLKIIDLPGHERLRMQFFDEEKSQCRAIIFVVDSQTFQKELKDVAQLLYQLLSDAVVSQNYPPFLIACNKQDLPLSKGSKVIQSQLEKEMNTLRITQSAMLEMTTSAANNNTFLGKTGKDFEFSHLLPIRVEFAECSALKSDEEESADLELVTAWLEKIA